MFKQTDKNYKPSPCPACGATATTGSPSMAKCNFCGTIYDSTASGKKVLNQRSTLIPAENTNNPIVEHVIQGKVNMDKWEYQTTVISWNKDKKDWVTNPIVGFSNILNYYGEQGWELSNLAARDWNSASVQGAYSSVDVYIAVFKRQKQ